MVRQVPCAFVSWAASRGAQGWLVSERDVRHLRRHVQRAPEAVAAPEDIIMPKTKSKGKAIKIPQELADLLEERKSGKPPGEVLLEIYKDYQKLEDFASAKRSSAQYGSKVSDIVIQYDERIDAFEQKLTEVSTMMQGLKIFFTKFKGS